MVPAPAMTSLLDICAQADAVIDGASLRQHGAETRQALIDAKLLKQAGLAGTVVCQVCFDDPWAEVEQTPDGEGLRYHCPTDGWTALDPEDATTWRVDLDALVRHIAVLLGAPKFIEPRHLVDGHLWGLGDLRIGTGARERRPKRAVFVVRRYNHPTVREAIHKSLTAHGKAAPMLVLDLTSHEDARYQPAAWKVHALMACRRTDTEGFTLDIDLIVGLNRRSFPQADDDPVRVFDDYRIVKVGKHEFKIGGVLQRRIIQYLHEHHRKGKEWASEATMFAILEHTATSRTPQIFKGSGLYGVLLECSKGFCRLRIDELLSGSCDIEM